MKRNVIHIQIGKKRIRIEKKHMQIMAVLLSSLSIIVALAIVITPFIKEKLNEAGIAPAPANPVVEEMVEEKVGLFKKKNKTEENIPDTNNTIQGTVQNPSDVIDKEWLYESGHTEEDVIILSVEMINANEVKKYPATEPQYVISDADGNYYKFRGSSYKQGFADENGKHLYTFISLKDPTGYSPTYYEVYVVKSNK